jgi:hypothetical protein
MVNALAACLLAFVASGQAPDAGGAEGSTRAVHSALGKGNYPWYDAGKDAVRPIALPRDPEPSQSNASSPSRGFLPGLGNLIATIGLLIGLAALIGLLVWFWRIYEPTDPGEVPLSSRDRGEPSRIEALPAGMRREFESSDPWEEALRRRALGDLAGAVVCLFAHQLLTMSRLGLVRLAPGRTGRQLLRSVTDVEFRRLSHPTLRQFEAVYYGHRTISAEEFAAVWDRAEAFERRVARGVVA